MGEVAGLCCPSQALLPWDPWNRALHPAAPGCAGPGLCQGRVDRANSSQEGPEKWSLL